VTSPPEHCAEPSDAIEGVQLPARVSNALAALGRGPDEATQHIPLVLALEWARDHDEAATSTGVEIVRELIARLTGRDPGIAAP
jgi:hypothetical protein